MDREPDFPENSTGLKCQRADETTGHTFEDEATEVQHLLTEPKSINISVDGLLHFGKENLGRDSEMEEVSRGYEFGFTPNYGGLDSYNTLEGEGLKLEILDGLLDEIDEVDDIYAAQDLSTACDHFLLDIEFTEKVSELDCGLRQVPNSGSESQSPGFSESIDGGNGLSESPKETVPESNCRNESLEKEVHYDEQYKPSSNCESEEPAKVSMLTTLIVSEKKREDSIQETEVGTHLNQKGLRKCPRRLESHDKTTSHAPYDFRPRRGHTKECPPTTMDLQSDQELNASEFEDEDDCPTTKKSKNRGDRRKHQRMWTITEVTKLVDGISQFGVGKWTSIKKLLFPSAAHRTPIDLRDKWRNLLRASYAHIERHKHNHGEVEDNLRPAARPLPKHIVQRIHELAVIHPYKNAKSSSSGRDATNGSVRRTSRRKSRT